MADFFPGSYLPETDGAVLAEGGQPLCAGLEGEAVDLVVGRAECTRRRAIFSGPKLHLRVYRRELERLVLPHFGNEPGKQLAIGGKGERAHVELPLSADLPSLPDRPAGQPFPAGGLDNLEFRLK